MAENLNLLYSPQPSLQEGFLDKNTGLPLVNGLVYSFANQNRNVLKPIYTIQEAVPGGPVTYVPLPNPIVLSGIGTIQDNNGNDVIPYFFPYDANGNVELYFILVTDQFGSPQFTREAFPNVGAGTLTPTGVILTNYVPNGQFLIHNASSPNVPKSTFNYGIYTTEVFQIAPGGWTFERTNGSTATDTISFSRTDQFTSSGSASPRYSFKNVRSAGSATDTVCDLRIKFMDVNKFASVTGQQYTLLFTASSTSGITGVSIQLIDYYGSATGSVVTPTTTTDTAFSPTLFNLSASVTQDIAIGVFVPIVNAVVSDNDDDFIQLAFRFPTTAGQTFDVEITDVMLIAGKQPVGTSFQETTNGDFLRDAFFNIAPTTIAQGTTNYYSEDGSNLYLPTIMTPEGMTYDYSSIGKIESLSHTNGFYVAGVFQAINTNTNLLYANGASYITKNYSPIGIPYARLQSILFNTTINGPIYGTGANFVFSTVYAGNTALIKLTNNQTGLMTHAADGAVTTGYTITTTNDGSVGYAFNVFEHNISPASMLVVGNVVGAVTNATAGTSGFTVLQNTNAPGLRSLFYVDASAGLAAAGTYITYTNTTTAYSLYFNINGVNTPAGPGTQIPCNLLSSFTVADQIGEMRDTVNGYQITHVLVTGQPTSGAGSYFTFHSNTNLSTYNVWYQINNVGAAPAKPVVGDNIMVSITSTMTAAQIATATQKAINSYQFAVPALQGLFLRGWEQGGTSVNYPFNDPTTTSRFSMVNTYGGNQTATGSDGGMGTYEWFNAAGGAVSGSAFILPAMAETAGEIRPLNFAVNYVIRY